MKKGGSLGEVRVSGPIVPISEDEIGPWGDGLQPISRMGALVQPPLKLRYHLDKVSQ